MFQHVYGIAIVILTIELRGTIGQPWFPGGSPNAQCLVQSHDRFGQPAYCDYWSNVRCPNRGDTCQPFPGSSYGPCCLGCLRGPPLPGRVCGGWAGTRCPEGFICRTSPFMYGAGVCCHGDDYDDYDDHDLYEDKDHYDDKEDHYDDKEHYDDKDHYDDKEEHYDDKDRYDDNDHYDDKKDHYEDKEHHDKDRYKNDHDDVEIPDKQGLVKSGHYGNYDD